MPNNIAACSFSVPARICRLTKNWTMGVWPSFAACEPVGTRSARMTEYSVNALMTCRGPSAKQTRSHAGKTSAKARPGLKGGLAFKFEIREQGHILGTFPAFGQSSKDEEAPPSPAVSAHTYALKSDSEWIEVACGDDPTSHSSYCSLHSVYQEDPSQYDAGGKYPSRVMEWYHRFDLTRPSIEKQQVGAGEYVNCIYSHTCDSKDDEEPVGKRG
jgi:hypothetical protein